MALQNESRVIIADNSWAKEALIFKVLKWNSRNANIWDLVSVAIKSASPSSSFKKWDVSRWIIVRTRKEIRRKDWTYVRFWDNAIALLNKSNEPVAKRIFGPVARELREKWYKNVANLAEEIL